MATLFVMRQPPYQGRIAREGLDALLTFATFELKPALLFLDAGVLQLLPYIDDPTLQKQIAKMLSALPIYGVEQIYIERESLTNYSLQSKHINLPTTLVERQQLPELMTNYDFHLSF
jgi:tRNA 2-thiouridine synthesizing protein C